MSNRINTLWDKKDSSADHEDRDHPHPDGQAFYAGGSEHSGQQILGPTRDEPGSDRLVQNLFEHARQSAARYAGADEPGQSEANSLPIVFWRNGFTVGHDGELREYVNPENRQFLDSLKRGETPQELFSRTRGGTIDVKLENKASLDYQPDRKTKAFSGEGHRLGAPAPGFTAEEPTTAPGPSSSSSSSGSTSIVVDDSEPVTSIRVRLVDNTTLVIRANETSRIADLVSHIRTLRPQFSDTNFVLATTFPAKELSDFEQTIKEAKLSNASVMQKIKR